MNLTEVTAKELMSCEVLWAEASETLHAAMGKMRDAVQKCLLVDRGPGQLPGVITAKDIVVLLGSEPLTVLKDLCVGDVMSQPAICLPTYLSVRDSINLMRLAGVRRAPVQDGQTVVGMLALTDVFEHVAKS